MWRGEDYGAAVNNWRVAAHPNGLIYVANNDGVLEFDGESWRFITMPGQGSARSLAIDARGRVWVGGHDDLCRLEPDERGTLRAVSALNELPADHRELGTISRSAVTADGVYLRSATQVILFRHGGGVQTWLVPDNPGMIWTMDGELYADLDPLVKLSPAGPVPISLGSDVAATDARALMRVFAAQREPAGQGWVLLTSRGPVRWAGAGAPFVPFPGNATLPFARDLASAGAFLPDGRLALGTERTGLFILSAEGALLQQIDRAQGLPGNRINDLALDPEGGLWVALQEGLARIDVSLPFARHGAPQGLTGTARRFATFRGQLYLSHSESVARRDPTTGRFVTAAGFQVGSNRPLAVGDRIVASTRGLREILPNDQSRQWTQDLIGPMIASRQAPGTIVAGSAAGVSLLTPADGGWQSAGRLDAINTGVDELFETDDGQVWVVTRAGKIWRIDFRAGLKLNAPAVEYGEAQGVPPAARRDHVQIVRLGRDLLAIGAGWVRRYDPAADRFVPETRLRGRHDEPESGALALGPAADGGVWLQPTAQPERAVHLRASPDGAWSRRDLSIAAFRALRFDSVFEEAATRTLWLAGQGALVSVDLAWRPPAAAPPLRALIRRITNREGEVLFGGGTDSATALASQRLRAADHALRAEFAATTFAVDYLGQNQTLYRTRLDGLEEKWTPWTREAHREFTNLPYRALTLRVQARAIDGRESAETILPFAIVPPWWLSSWAFAFYAAAAALAVAGLVALRTQALHARARHLEAIVASRTAELATRNTELARLHQLELDEKIAARLSEEKARLELLRYQLNPHFLLNAFTTLRSLVFSRPDAAGDMVSRLAEFCRIALTRSDETGATVAEEARLVESYLATEKARWRDELVTSIDVDPAAAGERLPPFLLQPLVENAVKYGGRTSPRGLEVRVTIAKQPAAGGNGDGGALHIEVANTGAWVEPDSPLRIGSTGLGLDNLRQRLRRYYPDRHELRTESANGWVRLTLRLALAPARAPQAQPAATA